MLVAVGVSVSLVAAVVAVAVGSWGGVGVLKLVCGGRE